ncbi:unnamed protein product [Soboliphyme baturini]|uniref:Guanylate kinase-like domain-containing protein n=1 Tax=Soboliphyme baturini TaxID=241478 RepID=A0A3P8DTX8_9BILA|nr:unnamed protein product [Soboliphyme baturini]
MKIYRGSILDTTRPKQPNERDGVPYYFVSKQAFQEDATSGKFVEWGEYQKHLYGTSFGEIRRVIQRGRTCVLTLKPQSIPVLRNSDLMPYVIFIAPTSLERLKMSKQRQGINGNVKEDELKAIVAEAKKAEEQFGHYFDKVIVNYDLEQSFHELRLVIHRLESEPQWVPSVWLKSTNSVSNNLHQ